MQSKTNLARPGSYKQKLANSIHMQQDPAFTSFAARRLPVDTAEHGLFKHFSCMAFQKQASAFALPSTLPCPVPTQLCPAMPSPCPTPACPDWPCANLPCPAVPSPCPASALRCPGPALPSLCAALHCPSNTFCEPQRRSSLLLCHGAFKEPFKEAVRRSRARLH